MAEAFIVGGGGGAGSAGTKSIKDAVIKLSFDSVSWDSSEHEPTVESVTLYGQKLVEKLDYYVLSEPESNAGTYYVQVVGVVNYSGGVSAQWKIEKATGSVTLSASTLTVKGAMGTSDSSITVTAVGDGTVTAESQSPENALAEIQGSNVKVTSVKAGSATVIVKVTGSTNHTDAQAELNVTVEKGTGSISVEPAKVTLSGKVGSTAEATLTYTGDGDITITGQNHTSVVRADKKLTLTSVSEGEDSLVIKIGETENYTGAQCTLTASVRFATIWGVQWNGGPETTWTRTDAAADFPDPNPYYSGMSGSPSSPFDELMPWAGMTEVDDPTCGKLIKIPKFWYKLEEKNGGLSIQISDGEQAGFSVSPAHMARGTSEPECDTVYIGKYHCATDTYKSEKDKAQACSINHSTARTNIQKLGQHIYMTDFHIWFTIWLLYLVEFADWNSQAKIGYGCSVSTSSKSNNGITDTISYHTGTTETSRTTWGWTKYRNIEGLWDNVWDWLDGCYNATEGIYVIEDMSKFDDTQNGTLLGKPNYTGGEYPKTLKVKDINGFKAFYPVDKGGSSSTYTCDGWNFSPSNPCLYVGGQYYSHSANYGLFYISYNGVSNTYSYIGARLQKRTPLGGV